MRQKILGSGEVETFTTSLHAVMKVRYYSTPGFREETLDKNQWALSAPWKSSRPLIKQSPILDVYDALLKKVISENKFAVFFGWPLDYYRV